MGREVRTVVTTVLPSCRGSCLQIYRTNWNGFKVYLIILSFTFPSYHLFLMICCGGQYFCDEGSRKKQFVEWRRFGKDAEVLLYCIVIESRRLVPSDALQPKAYCTNPGL